MAASDQKFDLLPSLLFSKTSLLFSKMVPSKTGWTPNNAATSSRQALMVAMIGLISLSVILILVDYIRVLRLRQRLPPSMFPLPIVGNYFQVPRHKPWEKWEALSNKYENPLIVIWNGHRPVILCHDAWTMSELCEKRAAIYSSRPRMIAIGDMPDCTTTNQPALVYGDQWRIHRRLMHMAVGSQAVRSHRPFLSDEGKILTLQLLETPDQYVSCIERYSCSVVSIIGWGRRIATVNDPISRIALAMMESVNLVIPCYTLVETIPFLINLPGWIYSLPVKTKRRALQGRAWFYSLCQEAATKGDNFSKSLIDGQREYGITKAEVASLTGNLIGGGVDTTSASMISFVLAMCVFPEVQRKAQEELDRVVGHERSPTSEDEASLPYLAACVSEVLRWRTVTTLGGLPHAPIQDDEYRGYFIPAGTSVTGNVWAIHRHPREFPAPDSFRPERFLNGLERPYPNKQGHNAFGWGRRACSGEPMARQSLSGLMMRMLWAFDIRPGLDDEGKEVTLDIFAYNSSENTRPLPFKARFVPRSERIVSLIRSEAKAAQEALKVYDGETNVPPINRR